MQARRALSSEARLGRCGWGSGCVLKGLWLSGALPLAVRLLMKACLRVQKQQQHTTSTFAPLLCAECRLVGHIFAAPQTRQVGLYLLAREQLLLQAVRLLRGVGTPLQRPGQLLLLHMEALLHSRCCEHSWQQVSLKFEATASGMH